MEGWGGVLAPVVIIPGLGRGISTLLDQNSQVSNLIQISPTETQITTNFELPRVILTSNRPN